MPVLARLRHKNPRLLYFLRHAAKLCVPRPVWEARRDAAFRRLEALDPAEQTAILARVEHYIRVREPFVVAPQFEPLRAWRMREQHNYHLDLLEHLRCFPGDLRVAYRFGDETATPAAPTLVKARPIEGDNRNSVLLKLNRIRHFNFVHDARPFVDKLPKLVWRGRANRPHRLRFLERFHDHPLCDVGQAHHSRATPTFEKPYLGIDEQLAYKFVLSIEGNDVATNLKWILSSNSLCFMVRPKFETWFLESSLVAGQHYVELAEDYSDLDEKLRHYNSNTAEALRIINHAHAFVTQFLDAEREDVIALLVLQRYFELSGQAPPRLRRAL
jgi:hypothetical protein